MARKDASPLPVAALVTTVLALGALAVAGLLSGGSHRYQPTAVALAPQPLAFEPTAGGAGYVVRGTRYELVVDGRGTQVIAGRGSIRTRLTGARNATSTASQRQTRVVNRYQGAKKNWRTGIPTFGRVAYRRVYPGIDLAYHGHSGSLEYDFIVRPGADPARIGLAISGADRLRIDANGNLVAASGDTSFRQNRPVAYQQIGGERQPVSARFVLRGNRARFELGRYDHTRPLVIDPTLTYGDYLGGSKDDAATRIAVDSSGNLYVVGTTKSASIPGTSGTRSSTTTFDAFVMRIAPDHSRTWVTYIGGSADDYGTDIGLDSQGRPYITGQTKSGDFPDEDTNTGLFGPLDSFTAALGTNGAVRWAHTLGAANDATYGSGTGIAVEGDGVSYVALLGRDTDPTVQNPTPPTTSHGWILKYDADGTWSDIWAVDGDGVTTFGPGTAGTSTIGGIGVKPGCASDCTVFYGGHVTKASFQCGNPPATTTEQVAYIGAYNFSTHSNPWGASTFNYYFEECGGGGVDVTALDVSNAGDPTMTGLVTPSDTAKKVHIFFNRYAGSNGWFDTLPFGASLEAASGGFDITHDAQDNLIIVGFDSAKTGDLNGAVQADYNGGFSDGTILKIFTDGPAITSDPGGSTPHEGAAIVFATLFGGTATDQALGVAADDHGNVYFVGQTNSLSKFPTEGATQSAGISGSTFDGFIGIIRPTLAQITSGPSGTQVSRDAKFTFTAGPEPGFAHAAEEVGAKFECKLSPRDSGFGPCPANGSYAGLPDGSYKFEVRAIDQGGTTAGPASRDFAVDTTPRASFTIAPNPALVGRPVAFDASASSAATPITKYEWDLDGNGTFETNTGTTPTVGQVYPTAATVTVGLRITDSDGRTGTTTNDLHVNSAGTAGTQFGVTINNGAQFTNDPNVVVTSTFPSFTTGLLFSNDGGFGKAQTFAAKKETNWKLDSSGPERLPKTLYVRFITGSITGETHQDDIILDETPPVVDDAEIDPAAGAVSGTVGQASAARLRKYRVKLKAHDKTSGVGKLQITANKKKPGKALKYKKKLVVKSAKRPKWVRVRDRAGNWSKWKKAR